MEPKRLHRPALGWNRRWLFILALCLVAWEGFYPVAAQAQTPVSLFQSFVGRTDYVTTGGSLRSAPNTTNACSVNGSSSNSLSGIPVGATIRAAYLYWAGSGSTIDSQVTFNGSTVFASRTFTATFVFNGTNFDFFSGFSDVTALVTGNGNYTFSGLTVNTGAPHCGSQAVLSGWGLIVVFDDPSEDLRAVNVFDGFQFFRGSSQTITVDTFRIPTPPEPINGKVSHITWEGDPQNSGPLGGVGENLTFNGTTIDDGLVPPASNPTVQQFDGTVNTVGSINEHGVDVDTYDVSALLNPGDTTATSVYSSGGDLVLLSAEVISFTTEPIVDLEISKSHLGDFAVGVNGDYTIVVSNNGPEPDGNTITVTDTLPAGLTYVSGTGTNWTCGAASQDVTCTHPGPVAVGASLPDLTLTVLPDAAAVPTVDNTANVTSDSIDNEPANNTATDATTVVGSDLSTATKGVVDLNGGDADPGETLRYTIALPETGGVPAAPVQVTDDMPGLISSFSIVSLPPGAVDNSTGAGTGANGTGRLDIANISVPANGTASIVFDVVITAGANPGDIISNIATIANGSGAGASPIAPNVVVSQSQIPPGGPKTLYLYDAATPDPNGFNAGAAPYLSRTPPAAPQGNVVVDRGSPVTWRLTPATQDLLTLTNGTIPVTLYVSKGGGGGNPVQRSLQVSLASTGAFTGPVGTPVTLAFAAPPSSAPAPFVFNVPLPADLNLATGSQLTLTVTNVTSGGGNRRTRIFPTNGGNNSRIDLATPTVIAISTLETFDGAYSGGTPTSLFQPSDAVFMRAAVTDPFGSFDIASASLDLLDANGVSQLAGVAMTEVFDDNASTKIYETNFTLPAGAALGEWTYRITAVEGTEAIVTDTAQATFQVGATPPALTIEKSATTLSDPFNNTTEPKAIPGAIVRYSLTVTNSGAGTVDADTLVLTDVVPGDAALRVSGAGAPTLQDGTPNSGITAITVTYTDNPGGVGPYDYTPTPDLAGFDPAVTGLQIATTGTMGAAAGGGDPNFSVLFEVRLQ